MSIPKTPKEVMALVAKENVEVVDMHNGGRHLVGGGEQVYIHDCLDVRGVVRDANHRLNRINRPLLVLLGVGCTADEGTVADFYAEIGFDESQQPAEGGGVAAHNPDIVFANGLPVVGVGIEGDADVGGFRALEDGGLPGRDIELLLVGRPELLGGAVNDQVCLVHQVLNRAFSFKSFKAGGVSAEELVLPLLGNPHAVVGAEALEPALELFVAL